MATDHCPDMAEEGGSKHGYVNERPNEGIPVIEIFEIMRS